MLDHVIAPYAPTEGLKIHVRYDSGAVMASLEPFQGHVIAFMNSASNSDVKPTVDAAMILSVDDARRLAVALTTAADAA